jgi:hypothetical protein
MTFMTASRTPVNRHFPPTLVRLALRILIETVPLPCRLRGGW